MEATKQTTQGRAMAGGAVGRADGEGYKADNRRHHGGAAGRQSHGGMQRSQGGRGRMVSGRGRRAGWHKKQCREGQPVQEVGTARRQGP